MELWLRVLHLVLIEHIKLGNKRKQMLKRKQKQPHLGIGLHIARLITEFHGGQIRAENRKDREGVTVSVVIPLFYR